MNTSSDRAPGWQPPSSVDRFDLSVSKFVEWTKAGVSPAMIVHGMWRRVR